MAYELTYTRGVLKQLKKLDRAAARWILDYMDSVAELDDPRSRGKELSGELRGIWRYGVGNYRVLCRIDDPSRTVHVLDADHRRRVYK